MTALLQDIERGGSIKKIHKESNCWNALNSLMSDNAVGNDKRERSESRKNHQDGLC